MSTSDFDERLEAYLWNPAEPPVEEVAAVERQLAAARFDAVAHPWKPPAAHVPRRVGLHVAPVHVRRFAYAATFLLAAAVCGALWRWSWPAGEPWTIARGTAGGPLRLAVGSLLRVPASEHLVVNVARIGVMEVQGGSALTLRTTRSNVHRLSMDQGRVHVRVWAPPLSLAIRTPAGEVIDMGCEFDLSVTQAETHVSVLSGWVQLDNGLGETLVPQGAVAHMSAERPPVVPVFHDAAPGFLSAVRQLELVGPVAGPDGELVRTITGLARPRDVLTLLMLADRSSAGRERLLLRAAELWPPPGGVTVSRVLRGDRDALWRWRDTLPLPPPKSWVRNWRDALPRWFDRSR